MISDNSFMKLDRKPFKTARKPLEIHLQNDKNPN
jgi:hypothetical protein